MDDPINHTDPDGNDVNNCHPTPGQPNITTCEGITSPPPRPPIMVTSIVPGQPQTAKDDFDTPAEKRQANEIYELRNCIENAIRSAASAGDVDLMGWRDPFVILVGEPNGSGGYYGSTELNLSGGDPYAMRDMLCGLGFANNNQCPGGIGNNPLVGPPHTGFQGNFRLPGLTNSLQINIDYTGRRIQLDVDPFNPSAGFGVGAILHVALQVFPNNLTGTDNTYGCKN